MNQKQAIEIGLVIYKNTQMAAVLGLTDLLMVASKIAAKHRDTTDLPLQVSHWEIKETERRPTYTFSGNPDNVTKLVALIIAPTLKAPIEQQTAAPWLNWLRENHAEGVV